MSALLNVENLTVSFGGEPAILGIDFSIAPRQRVGLIGESGSGKSVTALTLMGLLAANAQVSGSITFQGRQLLGLADRELAKLRGHGLGMVFQEPMSALDPTMKVGRQVAEVLRLHAGAPKGQARQRVVAMLEQVGLADPARIADSYPHQLSGGQRQRALIAMALINAPDLLICDEPTTALDVSVQAKVLNLLDRELTAAQAACLFISHDLTVVAQVCDYLLVMYRGQIVERGELVSLLANPQHPYTRGLLATASIEAVAPGHHLPVLGDFWTAPADGPGHD